MAHSTKKAKGAYHHGNLREAVIAAAAAIVSDHGANELTIRSVAVRAGVTHTAVYHHFPDRAAIVASVAEHGFIELKHMLDATARPADSALKQFRRMGGAYVKFARAHPRLYGVMFGAEAAMRHSYAGLANAAFAVFGSLVAVIARCQTEGTVVGGPAAQHALFGWSTVHGLASLIVEGQLREIDEHATIEAVIDMVVARVFLGLAPNDDARQLVKLGRG